MTEIEKILAGTADIKDYNIDIDFDNDEMAQLLEADVIAARDIGISRASDLLIDGLIDYSQYPFEDFSPYEQIRQLKYCAIAPADFLARADLETYDCEDWLFLLSALPRLADTAPWEDLRSKGSAEGWMELLKDRPELAPFADWNLLAEKAAVEDFFDLLREVPELYAACPNKKQLLAADSMRWVKLLVRRPEFADIYPMDTLDEVDEIEFLLLHQPQLASRIHWDEQNPPTALYITNLKPETLAEINPAMAWFITSEITEKLRPILAKKLFYNPDDAWRQANIIGHNKETFAGIYSRDTAEEICRNFSAAAAENNLSLQIRKEVYHGN